MCKIFFRPAALINYFEREILKLQISINIFITSTKSAPPLTSTVLSYNYISVILLNGGVISSTFELIPTSSLSSSL